MTKDLELLPDGVYFNLNEDRYHAERRLSSTGIKELLIGVATYWAKSWMNESRERADPDTLAKTLGSAYHVAIFEPEKLSNQFAKKIDPSDHPNALMTDTAVCAELKSLGQTQKKSGENALERAKRLIEIDPNVSVLSILEDEWQQQNLGKTPIAAKYWDQIQNDISRIEENPEISEILHDGFSEVSVFWTCPESGIPMKARFDKLAASRYVDMKSFANPNGKETNRAIFDQIRFNRYYIQARLYQVAINMIRDLDLQVKDLPTDEQLENSEAFPPEEHLALIEEIKARKSPHEVFYFFQEKNGVPNLLLRRFRMYNLPDGVNEQSIGAEGHTFKEHRSGLAQKADMEIGRAKVAFSTAMQVYGPDQPWYPFDMVGEITDADFNRYWLEGE